MDEEKARGKWGSMRHKQKSFKLKHWKRPSKRDERLKEKEKREKN